MMHFEYPSDIDDEMIPLLDRLNNLPGVSSQFCCCGHGGRGEFYILLHCTSIITMKMIYNAFNHSVECKHKESSDVSSFYVMELSCIDNTPNGSIGLRISNDIYQFMTEDERKTEYGKIINNIKEQLS